MNAALELLSELRESGMTVRADGSSLYVRPKIQDVDLRERLCTHKAEILVLLAMPIPRATAAESLAHDLVRLSTEHNLNLHAVPNGVLIEVTGDVWREVMNAIEEAGYYHVV